MPHVLTLRKSLERTVRLGHPWVYREALDGALPEAGDVVDLHDSQGAFLARGLSDTGAIGLRLWTLQDEALDEGLLARRIEAAAALRDRVLPPATNAYRLLHGEGDRLPGVVCDVYGDTAVLRLDGSAAMAWRDRVVKVLWPVLQARGQAHLLIRVGARGQQKVELLFGQKPEGLLWVEEHGMRMPADLLQGQKTGLFLDHRESRRRLRDLAKGRRVLNLYGYTGGFSVSAGLGGADHVCTVDRSRWACDLADSAWEANGLAREGHESHAESVQVFLENLDATSAPYDLIVSDPPSFAPSQDKRNAALQAYRALHRSVFARIAPGGLVLAASCSSHVNREDFDKSLVDGARQAGGVLQVLVRWGAPADHPRLGAFPEGDYLKVSLCRLLS